MEGKLGWLKEIGESLVISLIIVFLIRTFLFQPFFVKGQSMENNFEDGDYLLVDEITPRFFSFKRGEVIVFRSPLNNRDFYIKRIIGLPGERVVIKDGKVKIFNQSHPGGFVLDESSYLGKQVFTSGNVELKLSENEVFVLGDNRPFSLDSRTFGPVKISKIVGLVRLRAWPFQEASVFRY